jgi:predicted lipid carrier protein YhbT
MRVMDALNPTLCGPELRIVADRQVTKNLIPVDYFADVAWRLIRRNLPGTYHIVHPRPPTFADLHRIFAELFGLDNIKLVSPEEFGRRPATKAERVGHRAMTHYLPYLLGREPKFDTTATDAALGDSCPVAPLLDVEYFRRLLAYARQVDWGRKAAATPVNAAQVRPVEEYFEVFLARKLNQSLLPDLRRLSSRFAIVVRDSPEPHWALEVDQGVLTAISRNGMPTECQFTLGLPTFLELVSGRLAPQQAFFRREVEISGNVELGLRIAAILAQFFRKFPFVPTAE